MAETVSDKLQRAGYGHRQNDLKNYSREVYSLSTGIAVGHMDALEASAFADAELAKNRAAA